MYNSVTEHKRTEGPRFPPRGPLSRRDFLKSVRVVKRLHKYVEDLLDELIAAMAAEGEDMSPKRYPSDPGDGWSDSED